MLDVVPFVPSEIVEEEQVEMGEDVGLTSKGDVNQIEMDLEKIILMIKEQENVIFIAPLLEQENVIFIAPLLEQENANEDVQPHAHIDGSDIAMELHLL
jgi:hypothetical protein